MAFVRLGDVAIASVGNKPKLINESKDEYEYINAGTTNSGYTESSNCDGDTVTTPSRGQGGIGFVGYQNEAFWLGPLCYRIQSRNKALLSNKYLYYYLANNASELLKLKKEGGVPALNQADLIQVVIEMPLIEVQERIVATLDRFDKLCNDISGGLPAEIVARQKQYEYYREKLLKFND